MNENQQAEILATWLTNGPGTPTPTDVDAEVLETIFALRPDYAPHHGITIEQVLSSLTEGPLVDPAVAEALQQWLASPPGTAPPPSLPIGVVEATYVLRPDLAPALQVGIGDILGEIQEGPLAETPVVHMTPKPVHRRWWANSTMAVAAVAATALFFVGPLSNKADEPVPSSEYIGKNTAAIAEAPAVQSVQFDPSPAPSAQEKKTEASVAPAPQARTTEPPAPALNAQTPEHKTHPEPMMGSAAPAPPPFELTPPIAAPTERTTAAEDRAPIPAKPVRKTRSRNVESSRRATEAANEEFADEMASPAEEDAEPTARPLRLDPQIGTLERQAEADQAAGKLDEALRSLELALALPTLNRFDTARIWRRKAVVLALMGRETDAKHARETAAKLDPTR